MPNITAKTSRKEATIKGVRLEVPTPFLEGHVLLVNEANVLNQTYIENIRNNCSGLVAELIEKAGGIENLDMATVQAAIDAYCVEYIFGQSRGGGFRSSDPVEAEAMSIARAKVREAIVKKGLKLKDVPAAKITEIARDVLKKNPKLYETAKRAVTDREAAAKSLSLDITV